MCSAVAAIDEKVGCPNKSNEVGKILAKNVSWTLCLCFHDKRVLLVRWRKTDVGYLESTVRASGSGLG